MLCPNCEAENREGARFCDECGFPLTGVMTRGGASPAGAGAAVRDGASEPADDIVSGGPAPAPEPGPAPAPEQPAFGFEDFPTFDYPGTAEAAPGRARPDRAPAGRFEPPRNTVPFEGAPAPEPPAAEPAAPAPVAGREDADPFAGYSQGIDEREYGFTAPNPAGPGDAAGREAGRTMEMPRVDQPPAARAARDFRIAPSPRGRSRSRIAAVVAAGAVAGIAIAALVTYLLGFWGGVAVPDVTGMTESDARAVLEEGGFAVRSTQVKSDDTEGLVLVMDPAGGSRAAEGSEVVIHISTARFVPDVTGKGEDEARALLEESGYENVRYEKVKSEGEEGVVLSVTPEAGTRAKSNAEIVVGVSEAYRVPDVSGLGLDAAAQAIVDSGLVYGVAYVDSDQYEDGAILGTDPEAGAKVEKDSYVSINVARRRGAELVALTQAMFAPGQTVTIGGVDYEVESADSVVYAGDDVVSFSITALPKTTFFGKTIYADEQVVSGQVAWSEDNEVIGIS